MSEVKVGDKVRIKQLEEITDKGEMPGWVGPVMDRYAGCELTVTKVTRGWFYVEECTWAFSHKWIDTAPQSITVPIDPSCVPAGYRAVRVNYPVKGDLVASYGMSPYEYTINGDSPRLIVEKIPDPIVLPDWIPAGWWIAKDHGGDVYVYFNEPTLCSSGWDNTKCGDRMYLRELRDTLPKAYLDLPWKESLMQKEVKG